MSTSKASRAVNVPLNAAWASVTLWAALSTGGVLAIALWVFVALYVLGVLVALILGEDLHR